MVSERQIAALLLRLWKQQHRAALDQVAAGQRVDLSGFALPMAEALAPLLRDYYQRGGSLATQRIAQTVAALPGAQGMMRPRRSKAYSGGVYAEWRVKNWRSGKAIELAFDVFNPRVLDSVWASILELCQATLATTEYDVNEALRKTREELAEGLEGGETAAQIAERIGEIFQDSERAELIAATETARAVHGGQLLAAKESGIVTGLTWQSGSAACDICLSLQGKTVGVGEAFWIDPKGGLYAIVLHPPLHPRCDCVLLEEISLEALGIL